MSVDPKLRVKQLIIGVQQDCGRYAELQQQLLRQHSLLAAHDTRADIRVMVYDGKQPVPGATPNLRKPAKTVRGPLVEQIDAAVRLVLDELAAGLTLAGSGFKARHVYPERVVKEAIVNAVIHRDYRLNRDIFVRIFDDRIEVENPGLFPGRITPDNSPQASGGVSNLPSRSIKTLLRAPSQTSPRLLKKIASNTSGCSAKAASARS